MRLPPETIVALAAIPFAGKFVGAFIGVFLARLDRPYANATGLLAKGVSGIALLLVLVEVEIIGQDVFSFLVLVMFGYILLMPPAINFAVSRAAETHHPTLPAEVPPSYARYALGDMRVRHVTDTTRAYPASDVSVKEFPEHWIVHDEDDYVVVDDGTLAGVVSLARVQRLPPQILGGHCVGLSAGRRPSLYRTRGAGRGRIDNDVERFDICHPGGRRRNREVPR